MSDHPSQQRRDWARSYLRRQGRTTPAQKRAIRTLWPSFGLTFQHGQHLDLEASFGRQAHTVLEIGFGKGDALVHLAQLRPDWNILGIETHRPGVGATLKAIEACGVTHVRLIRGDAIEVLAYHLGEGVLDEVCIFFPDPWPHAKDVSRRIVRPWVVGLVAQCLRPGGLLHLATDVDDYAHHMVRVMNAASGWHNRWDASIWAPRPPWRALTKYERRAGEEGRSVWDLCFVYDR
ncbi:MAG: tRNA (guanosine(46)-N7)-methyltransferase TrmB [Myxococcota bacterium]